MCDIHASELLPHRPPMLLVDRILTADIARDYICAAVQCSENDLLYDSELNGIMTSAAVEIMAQSIGLLSGYSDLQKGHSLASMGKLLSIKQYQVYTNAIPVNTPLQAEARGIMNAPPIGVYECKLKAGEQLLAEAELTVLRED